jgi:hypothetical protein
MRYILREIEADRKKSPDIKPRGVYKLILNLPNATQHSCTLSRAKEPR